MQVRLATAEDAPAWDAYVANHEYGTIFHSSSWQNVVSRSFSHPNHSLIAESDGEIGGILPLFELKSRLFGHSLVSVPFAELGGPLTESTEITNALLDNAAECATGLGCDYIELKNQHKTGVLPTKDLYVNFSKHMFPEAEENLLAIPRKSRAAVRKGIKSGLTAEFGTHLLDSFYNVMAHSYHQLGTPIFPKRFFRNFLLEFKQSSSLMVVRTSSGEVVAGVLSFYHRDRVMPYYAGSLASFRHLCPNDFMYWVLMKDACERGYRVFDFGRSKVDTGSFSFKKHWGFKPTPLAYQYQLIRSADIPNLSPANPRYARKIALWRKMPLALTKVVGPPLARYLG